MALTILLLGLLFLSLVYSDNEEKVSYKNDPWLRLRMQEVGIPTWRDLRKKAGIERLTLQHIRQDQVKKLNLGQLTQLANALEWQIERLLEQCNLIKNKELNALRHECQRLHTEVKEQSSEITKDTRESIFHQLQSLLTNYPSLRQMVQTKPDLPAKNVISLLTPLDNLLNSWEYETIGQAWEAVEYSPQLHQADSSEIQPGERVYVRFVGYRNSSGIICPAKVSRTLPGGTV